jgi:ABC-2 type transport system ATP-binding protein
MTEAIQVENLTKVYPTPGKQEGFLAVDEINFCVHQGEVFGFLGPNGAGKSTTQRMLTTLLTPTSGNIHIFGNDLSHDDYEAKLSIGMVPEESNVYTELSAWDNLIFCAQLHQLPKQTRQKRARELLETFGLWEKRHDKAENFSKGMRRRLSIAMAIIHYPKLLFLDEPTSGLDAHSTHIIHDLIRKLNADGATIFLTTHHIEEANQLCDRVAIINYGKIAAIDTPERLKSAFQQVQSVEVSLHTREESSLPSNLEHSLNSLSEVSTIVKNGDKWRLYTQNPSALLTEIINYAGQNQLQIISLNTLAPSLEDVYLQITGGQIGVVESDQSNPNTPRRKRGNR